MTRNAVDLAAGAAVEIDRLAIGVNREISPRHGVRLMGMADELGLQSVALLPHTEDWLLGGTLTRALLSARFPYTPPEEIDERIQELIGLRLVSEADGALVALPPLRPLLDALLEARAMVAADAWTGHERDAATVAQLGRIVAEAADTSHTVARAHLALTDPVHPFLRLEHRLFTLRYVRQADHVAAWTAAGLGAPEIVALTGLWQGEAPGASGGLGGLIDRGLAGADGSITEEGRHLRQSIEEDTNARAARSFAALDDPQAVALMAALRRLPDSLE